MRQPGDDLRALAADLRASVTGAETLRVTNAALAATRQRDLRFTLAMAILGLMAVANVALAEAADSAIPGEFLYPVDRAHEWVSGLFVADDHTIERMTEAETLVDRGDYSRALSLATEMGVNGGASHALLEEVKDIQLSENSAAVRTEVLDLVDAAGHVSQAAQSGDKDALREAIAAVHDAAHNVAETASGANGGSPPAGNQPVGNASDDSPSLTRPDNSRGRSQGSPKP